MSGAAFRIPHSALRIGMIVLCVGDRYIRYTVANQQLKTLQISYTSVTTITLLSINNLSSQYGIHASACPHPRSTHSYSRPLPRGSYVGGGIPHSALRTPHWYDCIVRWRPLHPLHCCKSAT